MNRKTFFDLHGQKTSPISGVSSCEFKFGEFKLTGYAAFFQNLLNTRVEIFTPDRFTEYKSRLFLLRKQLHRIQSTNSYFVWLMMLPALVLSAAAREFPALISTSAVPPT